MSAGDYRHVHRMTVNDRTASSRQLAESWSTATGVLISASTILRHLLHRGLRARVPLCKSPSRQTIESCVCNVLMSTEPCKVIFTKLSFLMNHAVICGTMISAFVLDSMPVNTAFQSALSNDIVADYLNIWYEV